MGASGYMDLRKIIILSLMLFLAANLSYGEESAPRENDYDLKIINEKLRKNIPSSRHTRTKTFKNNQRTEFISPLL